MTNSRVKEYFDLFVFIEREDIDSDILALALVATFNRRGMEVPETLPVGLTAEFANDATRQNLWEAFLKKNELGDQPLNMVIETIVKQFLPAWSHAVDIQNTVNNHK